jgi:hypothetical protein
MRVPPQNGQGLSFIGASPLPGWYGVDRICFPRRCESIALRCPASLKPRAAVSGRPFDACVSPMDAVGKTPVFHTPENKNRSTFGLDGTTFHVMPHQ